MGTEEIKQGIGRIMQETRVMVCAHSHMRDLLLIKLKVFKSKVAQWVMCSAESESKENSYCKSHGRRLVEKERKRDI